MLEGGIKFGTEWRGKESYSQLRQETEQLSFPALFPPFILLSTINQLKKPPQTCPTVLSIRRNTSSPTASTVFEKDKVKMDRVKQKSLILVQKILW